MNCTKIPKTDQEWKAELTPLQFEDTCKHGTERAFIGEYADHHEDCVCTK